MAWARISPMAAPWLKTTTSPPGWAVGDALDGAAQAPAEDLP